MRAMWTAGVAGAVVALLSMVGCGDASDLEESAEPRPSAEEAKAVQIALTVADEMAIPDLLDVEVVVNPAGEYVVTWPVRRTEPSLGAEFYLRVHVNLEQGVPTQRWSSE